MGALSNIGVIESIDRRSRLSSRPKTLFKDETVSSVENGFSIGTFQVPPIPVPLGKFASENDQAHADAFPAWNGMYVTGLLENVALLLDAIPDAGILKPIGLFDPTKPILIVINKLRSLFDRIFSFLTFSIDSLLLLHLDIVLSKADVIIAALNEVIDALSDGVEAAKDAASGFVDVIKDTVQSVMSAERIDRSIIDDTIQKISESSTQIKEAAVETALEITESVNLPIPSFPIPSLDVSFMQPDVNLAPLFATLEANQVDGIATKFIKLMTVFASLPSKIVQQIQEAVEFGEQLKNAFKKLITNVAEGVQELLDVLLGLVWSIITSAINVTSAIVLEAASVYQLVVFFVKYFIVSMISFLLGSGLIALSAASILGIA
jgi:hypothetical protein